MLCLNSYCITTKALTVTTTYQFTKNFNLYSLHSCRLFIAKEKLTEDVRKHLAPGEGEKEVEVLEYDEVVSHLQQLVADKAPGKLWVRNDTWCSSNQTHHVGGASLLHIGREGVLRLNVHSSVFAQGLIVLEHVIFIVILCEGHHG